jgi:hypothetical protein
VSQVVEPDSWQTGEVEYRSEMLGQIVGIDWLSRHRSEDQVMGLWTQIVRPRLRLQITRQFRDTARDTEISNAISACNCDRHHVCGIKTEVSHPGIIGSHSLVTGCRIMDIPIGITIDPVKILLASRFGTVANRCQAESRVLVRQARADFYPFPRAPA